jgi:site-specific DNA-methyltransferase (adenine-specific)
MRKLKKGHVDLIFADPPYNIGFKYDSDPSGDNLKDSAYFDWCGSWIKECSLLLKPAGTMFVLIDAKHAGRMEVKLREHLPHWRNTIIWWDTFPNNGGTNFQPAARFLFYFTNAEEGFTWNAREGAIREETERHKTYHDKRSADETALLHNVWELSRIPGTAYERVPYKGAPPQVPEIILKRCILGCSNPGDLVFDPFTGNGTTWKACRDTGRLFIGTERSATYALQAESFAKGAAPWSF